MKKILIIVAIMVLIIIIIVSAIGINLAIYNDGVCRKCGGHMVQTDIEFAHNKNHTITHYIFRCEECGHTIDLRINPKGMLDFLS